MKSSISFSVSNSSTASVVFIITALLRRRKKRRKKQRLLGIDDDFDEELGVLVIITLSFVPIFYTTSSSFPSLSFEEKKCDDRKQQHSVLSFCNILL
jgi:hypothetical protein